MLLQGLTWVPGGTNQVETVTDNADRWESPATHVLERDQPSPHVTHPGSQICTLGRFLACNPGDDEHVVTSPSAPSAFTHAPTTWLPVWTVLRVPIPTEGAEAAVHPATSQLLVLPSAQRGHVGASFTANTGAIHRSEAWGAAKLVG